MIMMLIGMFQGALLFAGIALGFNAIVFTQTNWGFLVLMTMIGALLGLLLGLLLRNAGLAHPWMLPAGSIVVMLIVGVLAMAFDFFIFGLDRMHWRGLASLSLISSAPGLVVGWILAQQFTDHLITTSQGGEQRFPSQAPASPPAYSPPRAPIPSMNTPSDFGRALNERLAKILNEEIRHFPPGVEVEPPKGLQDAPGHLCVSAAISERGQTLKLYLICPPNYPDIPPQLIVEQVDRLQSISQERVYRSRVIEHWGRNNRLRDIVEEVYQAFRS
jgi:hypothetical protein